MIKLFTSQNLPEVELCRLMLEEQGIACTIRNQYASIARGEIPFTDTWPELWVLNDAEADKARALLDAQPAADKGEDWTCPECGERIEAQFTSCWNCSGERP